MLTSTIDNKFQISLIDRYARQLKAPGNLADQYPSYYSQFYAYLLSSHLSSIHDSDLDGERFDYFMRIHRLLYHPSVRRVQPFIVLHFLNRSERLAKKLVTAFDLSPGALFRATMKQSDTRYWNYGECSSESVTLHIDARHATQLQNSHRFIDLMLFALQNSKLHDIPLKPKYLRKMMQRATPGQIDLLLSFILNCHATGKWQETTKFQTDFAFEMYVASLPIYLSWNQYVMAFLHMKTHGRGRLPAEFILRGIDKHGASTVLELCTENNLPLKEPLVLSIFDKCSCVDELLTSYKIVVAHSSGSESLRLQFLKKLTTMSGKEAFTFFEKNILHQVTQNNCDRALRRMLFVLFEKQDYSTIAAMGDSYLLPLTWNKSESYSLQSDLFWHYYLLSLCELDSMQKAWSVFHHMVVNAIRVRSRAVRWFFIALVCNGRTVIDKSVVKQSAASGHQIHGDFKIDEIAAILQFMNRNGIIFSHVNEIFHLIGHLHFSWSDLRDLLVAVYRQALYSTDKKNHFTLGPGAVKNIAQWGFTKCPNTPWITIYYARALNLSGATVDKAALMKEVTKSIGLVYGHGPTKGTYAHMRDVYRSKMTLDELVTCFNKAWNHEIDDRMTSQLSIEDAKALAGMAAMAPEESKLPKCLGPESPGNLTMRFGDYPQMLAILRSVKHRARKKSVDEAVRRQNLVREAKSKSLP